MVDCVKVYKQHVVGALVTLVEGKVAELSGTNSDAVWAVCSCESRES